jgi:predicted nucleic-acid-binding Zn-ribbon protein
VPLSSEQRQALEGWMRSKASVQCAACGESRWGVAEAAYVRALLEPGEADLNEDRGVVKVSCGNCGYLMLLDAETVGVRALWDEQRGI